MDIQTDHRPSPVAPMRTWVATWRLWTVLRITNVAVAEVGCKMGAVSVGGVASKNGIPDDRIG